MEESRDMARAPEPIDKEVSGADAQKGVSGDAPVSTGANGTDVMGPSDGAARGNQPITGVGPSKGVGGKAAAGAAVGTAAPVAAQAAALATFINWLKTVMMAAHW